MVRIIRNLLATTTAAPLLLFLSVGSVLSVGNSADRIPLNSVWQQTFYANTPTRSRRDSSPILQLRCRGGGKLCNIFQPQAIHCQVISPDEPRQWRCETDLPDGIKLGRTDVSCEGWNGPGDTFILKGSCALDYQLVAVPGSRYSSFSTSSSSSNHESFSRKSFLDRLLDWIFSIVLIGIVLMIIGSFLQTIGWWPVAAGGGGPGGGSGGTGGRRGPGGGGGGGGWWSGLGGGGGGTNAPPPPPYSKQDPSHQARPSSNSTMAEEGYRPGFWTGIGLGGIAAGIATSLLSNQQQQGRDGYGNDYDEPLRRRAMGMGGLGGWGDAGPGPGTRERASMRRSRFDDDSGPAAGLTPSFGFGGTNVR